ncbi:LysR family transcriptional regulator [Methylobacterium nodulans]|uniref:Transcriptional regulator, LysR family n=1 Tax=Methylobacterium nodulans (strain LMG 21967 / CNCM I-2342 / ORS 2060) TaxID=460265 RepID=B8IG74_METNO|nr:LysR substrate-binding domain-containing protein [Methylobacterium nodulans]ACL61551.1 transcriptional regulator, LysR family [Methylobacterium nodulans ORS 2060]
MDLTQLKTLIHVAELGSLSRAADRLHVAQPALSRQVRQLEEELGVVLFDRHGRGMVITEIGREILDHATRVMIELDAIRAVASGGRSSYRGLVRIGTTPTVAEIVTVPLVTRIQQEHPKLQVRFLSAFSGHLLDWLQRDELELAVSYDPKSTRSLRIVPVMMETLLLVRAAGNGLSLGRPVPFRSLAAEKLVLPSPRHGLRILVEECARQADVALQTSVEADAFGAMIDLVRTGFGSTILPLAPIYAAVERGELCVAPIVDPTPARRLVLAYPADRPVTPAARFVGQAFVEIAADLVDRKIWIGHMVEPSAAPSGSGFR